MIRAAATLRFRGCLRQWILQVELEYGMKICCSTADSDIEDDRVETWEWVEANMKYGVTNRKGGTFPSSRRPVYVPKTLAGSGPARGLFRRCMRRDGKSCISDGRRRTLDVQFCVLEWLLPDSWHQIQWPPVPLRSRGL